jgi:hypothetical protein
MDILTKFPSFTFYYITPIFLGFTMGLWFRDSQILPVRKKVAMSIADYYTEINEEIDKEIAREFPESVRLLKKMSENDAK